jgi:hypothetical protein
LGDGATQRAKPARGKTVVIGVIDDHTRLAYCELHAAENALNVSATLAGAQLSDWFQEHGCGPAQAVMSDNAKCYSRSIIFRETLDTLGAHHILIPPYTPRLNGKIERFFGTLDTRVGTRTRLGHQHRGSSPVILPSSASTTAGDHTQPQTVERPSAAFSRSMGRRQLDHGVTVRSGWLGNQLRSLRSTSCSYRRRIGKVRFVRGLEQAPESLRSEASGAVRPVCSCRVVTGSADIGRCTGDRSGW